MEVTCVVLVRVDGVLVGRIMEEPPALVRAAIGTAAINGGPIHYPAAYQRWADGASALEAAGIPLHAPKTPREPRVRRGRKQRAVVSAADTAAVDGVQ